MIEDLVNLEKIIGLKFTNKDLLEEALTHRSYLNEHRNVKRKHNERLEFLGDAVLELVVTEYLFKNYDKPEGELTNWRAALVKGESLAVVANELDIEKYLKMSKGERKDIGRARKYRLANMTEAIIGAIYLDGGYGVVKKFITKYIIVKLDDIIISKSYVDAKSYFQQKAQEILHLTPHYEILEESGPDHNKLFVVGVFIGDEKVAEGQGQSKQLAQKEAAKNGLIIKKWKD
jgi:ribonuclease-3